MEKKGYYLSKVVQRTGLFIYSMMGKRLLKSFVNPVLKNFSGHVNPYVFITKKDINGTAKLWYKNYATEEVPLLRPIDIFTSLRICERLGS